MRQRKRHPLDVPTPVAVALADFCRRAGAPVDPRTVRDALSLLDEAKDDHLLLYAAQAPFAKPLGPYAVIDIIETGMTPFEGAERQLAGVYDHVMLAPPPPEAHPPPEQAVPTPEPVELAADEDEAAPAPRSKKGRAAAAVSSRIAPKHRKATDPKPLPPPPAEPRLSAFRKRDLPKPRGRYTRVEGTRLKVETLFKPHLKEELEALIRQHGHRVAIRRALDSQYYGKKGEALESSDVADAMLHHGLRTALTERERMLVLSAVTDSRGDLARASAALGMKPEELDHIVLNTGAANDIAQIREHHAREALAHGNLRHKLELLDKGKYLEGLGVEKRFRDALALELKEVLDQALGRAKDVDGLVTEVARREGLSHEKLRLAMDRTGLSAQYQRRLGN